uniref:Retrovirus-related Pol polyprotein from transposon TNT 1-94 n=1 Tax=Tanacetum cinerariifolium TaxID=118510 RepID=A0A6L2KVX0_TANCI|nr:retrovirus-related Pol polyprotein from transposon TNT 1-94 [Tanacetum cinerariifolium]
MVVGGGIGVWVGLVVAMMVSGEGGLVVCGGGGVVGAAGGLRRPNGKMIVDSIENGPYVRRMIATLGEPDLPVPRRVTIVRQTKNLHEADFTQIYDFLKMNQDEVDELRASRLAKTHDPLALMAHSQNSFNFPTTHKDQSSFSTHSQQSFPINNKYKPQPSLNQNFMQPPMTSLEDINDPTEAMNAALILFAKAFHLTAPTNNNQKTSSNPRNHQIAQPVMNMGQDRQSQNVGGNEWWGSRCSECSSECGCSEWWKSEWACSCTRDCQLEWNWNCTTRPRRRDAAYLQTQLLIAQKEEARIQLQAEEVDFMAVAGDLDEIEEVNANCILMDNLQHASTSDTQFDKAPVYDTDGSAGVQLNDNCYDNEPDSFYHPNQKMAVGYPNPSYLKKAQLKQQSLYNGNLLLEEHDPPVVYDSEETLKLAQESREKMRFLKKEIKPANYAEINHLSEVFVPQTTKSKEELFLSNVSNMVTVSKVISIPNKDLSNDTTPSDARKFLNEVKSSLVTLQRVVKQKMTLKVHNWSSSAHKELERLQAQLRDLKGKSSDTPSASNTFDPLNQKLESKIVELEFQVVDKPKLIVVTPCSKKLHASIPSHSVPEHREFNVVKHRNVIAPGMFRINPSQTSRNATTTRNARVPSASKSSEVKKNVTVEDHRRTLLLSKNQKTMSSECNNIKLVIQNDKSEIVCDTCKQVLVIANHDACLSSSVNALNSRANKLCANVPLSANQKRHRTQVWKPKQVGSKERLACKSRLPRLSLKWSPSGRGFDLKEKLVASKETNCPNDDKACTSNPQEPMRKRFPNSTVFLGRVYFVEGLGHNLFSVGQFCDADLEVAFRRNTCFIRDLDGVELLKRNRSTNLYIINLYDMASDDYSRYTWVHFLRSKDEMPEVIKNFLKKIFVRLQAPVIIVRTDNGTEFKNHVLKEYFVSVGITHETSSAKTPQQNGVVERRNRTLVEDAKTMLIFSHAPLFLWAEAIATACYTQNRSIIHRRFNETPYKLIQGRKPNISYLHVFWALCYPKNDREDIGKLGAKGDIGFFIGYSANSVACRVYNRRTKKIIETMNVTFDELSAMAFEQNSSRLGLQSMTSGQISSELKLTYASSTITPRRPSERDLDILFEPLHNEYLCGRPSKAPRAIPVAPVIQNLQALTASMSFQDSAPTPTNSSNTPVSSHNVDATSQHAQHQRNLTPSPTASAADNVPNAVFGGGLFVNPFATPSTESVVSSTQYVDP